ncbi:single-stranded DNA-binding protein [Neisseria musculi]|uniref:Single-stranded DNA-binding protein n=1 Tax=Neisseria musculi TaxID=1815583 RepID=A0A7H1MAT0_9NEIS|nr:single-stranded DNA-binding protein [Neisseria musculi]QNT58745.1 single-strand binding family protein [Neisseria musculi]
MSVKIEIRGNIGDGIKIQEGERNGEQYKVLSFSVASTKRKKQIVNGKEEYVADGTTWYNCSYWNKDVDVLHANLQKGLPVTVTGHVARTATYTSKQTGEILPAIDVRVENVYLNLNSKRLEEIKLKPARGPNETDSDDEGDPF